MAPTVEPDTGSAANDDVDRELLDILVQTSFVVTGIVNRLAARHDMSLTQVRMLGVLRDRNPKMAELADHLGLEKSTVSGLVDRASQRGLVERRQDTGDARSSQVGLTAHGKQLAAEATQHVAADAAFLIESLSATDRKRLTALLQQLCAAEPPSRRS